MSAAHAVHPVAGLFPMLAADELADLAADIAERGLLQPVVLDVEGRVLDGRNRLAACEIAEVEPAFVTYEGDDPDGYALAVNMGRRSMTKGQQAVVLARAYKDYTEEDRRTYGVSKQYVSWARQVLIHASELADLVVSGARSLDDAYTVARKRKKDADSDDGKMLRLQCDAPDLASKVTEGDLELADAVAALDERQRKRAEQRRDARALLSRAVELLAPPSASNGFVDSWVVHLGDPDDELNDLIDRARTAGQVLFDLAERIKK